MCLHPSHLSQEAPPVGVGTEWWQREHPLPGGSPEGLWFPCWLPPTSTFYTWTDFPSMKPCKTPDPTNTPSTTAKPCGAICLPTPGSLLQVPRDLSPRELYYPHSLLSTQGTSLWLWPSVSCTTSLQWSSPAGIFAGASWLVSLLHHQLLPHLFLVQ